MNDIEKYISANEGLKLKPYKCTAGKLTIGYGRNLDDRGISEDEALIMLKNDIALCQYELNRTLDFYVALPDNVKTVLIDMCFNLGISGLLKFKNMLSAIKEGNYQKAGSELMNSAYAGQVPNRAHRNKQLLTST